MCDYSLCAIPNRLAEEGEELILHKFETGSLGFASVSDRNRRQASVSKADSYWATIKKWLLLRRTDGGMVICIPPGTRLLLTDIPLPVQVSLHISSLELVVFTELSDRSYSYRDALLLPNSTRVLLQDLPPGIHAVVLSVFSDGEPTMPEGHFHAA